MCILTLELDMLDDLLLRRERQKRRRRGTSPLLQVTRQRVSDSVSADTTL